MAWYDIPSVKLEDIQENGEIVGVQMSAKDFNRLIETMEDLLDNLAVEKVKKEKNPKFYSHEEIKQLIARKKR